MRSKYALRFIALGYLALLLGIPVVLVFINAFQDGFRAAWDAVTTPEAQHAFYLTFVMVAVAVPLNTIFGVIAALVIVRQRFRGRALLNAAIDLPFAVSPVVVGLSLLLGLWKPRRLDRRLARRERHPDHLLDAGHDPRDHVRLAAVRRPRDDPGAARDRDRAGAGGGHARRGPAPDVLPRDAPGDPLGRGVRRGAHHRPRARRVRRREHRVGQAPGPDRDRHAACRERVPALQRDGCVCRLGRARATRPRDPARDEPDQAKGSPT